MKNKTMKCMEDPKERAERKHTGNLKPRQYLFLHVTIQLPRKDEFACAATAARIQAPVCVVPYLQEL
jgi:hypothetical protein